MACSGLLAIVRQDQAEIAQQLHENPPRRGMDPDIRINRPLELAEGDQLA
jgi:hypothetical protein